MLQTVVAGSGAIQNIVWIPDVGVAVCSNRSKVRVSPDWFFLLFFIILICVLVARFPGRSRCELLQRVQVLQPRAGHLPHGAEEAGRGRPQHGAVHESLPGATAGDAAGAVRL